MRRPSNDALHRENLGRLRPRLVDPVAASRRRLGGIPAFAGMTGVAGGELRAACAPENDK